MTTTNNPRIDYNQIGMIYVCLCGVCVCVMLSAIDKVHSKVMYVMDITHKTKKGSIYIFGVCYDMYLLIHHNNNQMKVNGTRNWFDFGCFVCMYTDRHKENDDERMIFTSD